MKLNLLSRQVTMIALSGLSAVAWAQGVAPAAPAAPASGAPVSAATAGIRDVMPSKPVPGKVAQLSFMSGCWQARSRDGSMMVEAWFTPKDGTMIGLGQTTRGGKTTASEAMRVYQSDDTVKVWLRPDSRPELTMELDDIGDRNVGFIAKEGNDVIVRLNYDRKSDTELTASFRRIRGEDRRGAEFAFERIDCASVVAPVAVAAPAKQ